MTNFEKALAKVLLSEGGYVNDKDDAGGETYKGVTRKNHPNATMWQEIDKIKKEFGTKEINARLKGNKIVDDCIKSIYKKGYWDPIRLDEVNNYDLCLQLFSDAVNRGVTSAIRIAQQVCRMPITGKVSDALIYNLNHYEG